MIKILFLAANPSNTVQLALHREMRTIRERLARSPYGDSFVVESAWAVRPRDLQGALLEHQPQIVHFSGHGEMLEETISTTSRGSLDPKKPPRGPTGSGAILVEDVKGKAVPLDVEALGDLFRLQRGRVRCVVLNACHSAHQAAAIRPHVDCVIGMSQEIEDSSAIKFAGAFYEGLGGGKTVVEAFDAALDSLSALGLSDAQVPELLLRSNLETKDLAPLVGDTKNLVRG